MKNKLGILLFSITAIFGCIFLANAQERPPINHPPPEGGRMNREGRPNLLRALNLTAEQIDRVRQIHTEKHLAMREAARRLGDANKALDDAIYASDFDQNRVEALVKTRETAQIEVWRLKTEIEIAIRKLLTPEQLTKFRELRNRRERRDGFLRSRPGAPPAEMKERRPSI